MKFLKKFKMKTIQCDQLKLIDGGYISQIRYLLGVNFNRKNIQLPFK